MITTNTYTVGILLCGQFRDLLQREIFKGCDITFYEGRGFLDREFLVRGTLDDLLYIRRLVEPLLE